MESGDGDDDEEDAAGDKDVRVDEVKTQKSKKFSEKKNLAQALGKKSLKEAEKEAHIGDFFTIRTNAIAVVKQKTTNAYPTEYNGEDWQPKLEGIQESIAVRRHLFSVYKVNLLPPFTTGLQNWSTPSVIMRSVSVNLGNDGNGASAPVRHHCEYCPDHPDFNACAGAYLAPSMEFFYTAEQLYRNWHGIPGMKKEDVETFGFYSVGDIISIPGNDGRLHTDDFLNRFLVLGVIAHAQIVPSGNLRRNPD